MGPEGSPSNEAPSVAPLGIPLGIPSELFCEYIFFTIGAKNFSNLFLVSHSSLFGFWLESNQDVSSDTREFTLLFHLQLKFLLLLHLMF